MKTIEMKKAKLLSAVAILAMVFAVFAAIPMVADESDAVPGPQGISKLDSSTAAATADVVYLYDGKTAAGAEISITSQITLHSGTAHKVTIFMVAGTTMNVKISNTNAVTLNVYTVNSSAVVAGTAANTYNISEFDKNNGITLVGGTGSESITVKAATNGIYKVNYSAVANAATIDDGLLYTPAALAASTEYSVYSYGAIPADMEVDDVGVLTIGKNTGMASGATVTGATVTMGTAAKAVEMTVTNPTGTSPNNYTTSVALDVTGTTNMTVSGAADGLAIAGSFTGNTDTIAVNSGKVTNSATNGVFSGVIVGTAIYGPTGIPGTDGGRTIADAITATTALTITAGTGYNIYFELATGVASSFVGDVKEDIVFTGTKMTAGSWVDFSGAAVKSTGVLTVGNADLTSAAMMTIEPTASVEIGDIKNYGKLGLGVATQQTTVWGTIDSVALTNAGGLISETGTITITSTVTVATSGSIVLSKAGNGATENAALTADASSSARLNVLGSISGVGKYACGTSTNSTGIVAADGRVTASAETSGTDNVYTLGVASDVSNVIGLSYAIRAGFDTIAITAADQALTGLDSAAVDKYAQVTGTYGATGFVVSSAKYVIQPNTTLTVTGEDGKVLNIGAVYSSGTPASVTLVNNGKIILQGNADTPAKPANVKIQPGATLQNSGYIEYGTVKAGMISENLPESISKRDAPKLENLGSGIISVSIEVTNFVSTIEDVYVKGTTVATWESFNAAQRVIVESGTTWTIKAGNTVVINGEFIVEDGASIVIEGAVAGTAVTAGKLVIGSYGNTAAATIDGTITNYGEMEFKLGKALITGTIVSEGTFEVAGGDGACKVTNDGTITITADGSINASTMANNGDISINGVIAGATAIVNSGNVVINNGGVETAAGALTISIAAADATVDVQGMYITAISTLTINDAGLILGTYGTGASKQDVKVDAIGNAITVDTIYGTRAPYAVFSGLKVTEAVSGSNAKGYTHTMTFSGTPTATVYGADGKSMKASEANVELTVAANGSVDNPVISKKVVGKIVLPAETTVSIGTGVEFNVDGNGTFYVEGTLLQTASVDVPQIVNSGIIEVTGLVQGLQQISGPVVNAAYYITQIKAEGAATATTFYNYASFERAVVDVASADNLYTTKNVVINGTVTVKETTTVPAPIAVTFDSDSKLIVGDDVEDILTMAAGTKMTSTAGQVEVVGSLAFANKTNDKTNGTVSDVTFESEKKDGERTYTNLVTALNNASAGETITVTKTDGKVLVNQNLTIKDGVTLYVPDDAVALVLGDGVTLTVDGTLNTELQVYANTMFAQTASNLGGTTVGNNSSAIVVNGSIVSADAYAYAYNAFAPNTDKDASKYVPLFGATANAGAPIAGAYYLTSDSYVISNLDLALSEEVIAGIYGDINVKGAVTAGDLVFDATADCTKLVVDAATLNTNIVTSLKVSSLTLVGSELFAKNAFTGTVTVGDASIDAVKVLNLNVKDTDSKFVLAGTTTASADDQSLTVSAGTVYTDATGGYKVDKLTVASGATLSVNGTLTFGYLLVEGTLDVPAGKTVGSVEEGMITVMGTLNVAAQTATTSKGNFSADVMYVGLTIKDVYKVVSGAAAVVNGPVDVDTAFVATGSAVDAAAQACLDLMEKTEYFVEDASWMTAYDGTGVVTIGSVTNAPVKDAKFESWTDADGKDVSSSSKIGDEERVDAKIVYEIYTVTVYANEGIANMYIDNNLMAKGMVGGALSGYMYAFTAVVAAGSHTLTYDLANGWAGTAVFKVNGTVASNDTFTTSGTPGETGCVLTYNVQTSGIEKAGYVPDSPDTNDGMSITDILLIVLVVLIVVMAIIVAMRMMRS